MVRLIFFLNMPLLSLPYTVSRSVTIDAAPVKVFKTVRDFNTWTEWSPWLCTEKTAWVSVSGDGKTVGDVYSWKGELVGEGELEHSEIEPNSRLAQELRFTKPFKAVAKTWFTFAPENSGTKVTWGMEGGLPFFLFFMKRKMVAMMGADFDRGLTMLKSLIETGTIETDTQYEGIVQVREVRYLGVKRSESVAQLKKSMEEWFPKIEKFLAHRGVRPAGEPFAIYHEFDQEGGVTTCTMGVPVPHDFNNGTFPDGMFLAVRPEVRALKTVHKGEYRYLGNAWMGAYSRIYKKKEARLNKGMPPFEVYISDPAEVPAAESITEIYLPIR